MAATVEGSGQGPSRFRFDLGQLLNIAIKMKSKCRVKEKWGYDVLIGCLLFVIIIFNHKNVVSRKGIQNNNNNSNKHETSMCP